MNLALLFAHALDGIADVNTDCAATSDDPIVIRPKKERFGRAASNTAIGAWAIRDVVTTLRFDMHVGTVDPNTTDFARAFELLPGRTDPYGYLVTEHDLDPDGDPTGAIALRIQYDIPASAISTEALPAIITGLVISWSSHTRLVARANAAHASAKRRCRNRATALDIATRDLDNLVGLEPLKAFVNQLIGLRHVNNLRRIKGLTTLELSPHLAFTGAPGTGKTTAARLIGNIYTALGMLTSGHVIEVSRSQLVGQYIGHTATKTREACEKALGGVLFIDEAYSLHVDGRDFGHEAIEELMTFMENNRGNIAIIIAGYNEPIEQLLDSNPGLRSRFDHTIDFPHLTPQQLTTITDTMLSTYDYFVDETSHNDLITYFEDAAHSPDFANARDVRKLVEALIVAHSATIRTVPQPTVRQLKVITPTIVHHTLANQTRTDCQRHRTVTQRHPLALGYL
jgi:hypothetical protein